MNKKNILKELRTQHNLTQIELAKLLGIGQATIAGYENGNREPHIQILTLYADFFECSIDFLIGREDDFGNIVIKEKSPAPALTQAEQDLLDDFRSVPRPEQAQIAEYAHYVADKHATSKQKPIKKNA